MGPASISVEVKRNTDGDTRELTSKTIRQIFSRRGSNKVRFTPTEHLIFI